MECANCKPVKEISRIVYACAGCADVGEVADQVSRTLRKDGFATPKASCLVGIAAGLSPFIEAAKAADTVITIDGCEIVCAKKIIEHIGLAPQAFVLTEMGLVKGNSAAAPELTDMLCSSIKVKIEKACAM